MRSGVIHILRLDFIQERFKIFRILMNLRQSRCPMEMGLNTPNSSNRLYASPVFSSISSNAMRLASSSHFI